VNVTVLDLDRELACDLEVELPESPAV